MKALRYVPENTDIDKGLARNASIFTRLSVYTAPLCWAYALATQATEAT